MAGEFDFIDWIRAQQRPSDLVPVPAGDDLAVLRWPSEELLLVGADQVIDGVHFDSAVHAPRLIGGKAMNRNLSDCAAMACVPVAAVATVALPRSAGIAYAKELYLGLKEAGDAFGVQIVGGDTSVWNGKLVLSVTILGRPHNAALAPVRRSGARAGQAIFVTGPLGGSILGRHMTFRPRVELGIALAQHGVTAMIDLSDGLSRDLLHVCQASSVGAVLDVDAIPIHDDVVRMSRDGPTPLEHALHDGEDYELLYTCDSNAAVGRPPHLAQVLPPMYCVGQVIAEPGVWLERNGVRTRLESKAWEHRF